MGAGSYLSILLGKDDKETKGRLIGNADLISIIATVIMLPFWLVSMINPSLVLGSMLPQVSFDAGYIFSFRVFMTIAPLLSVTMTAMTFWPSINKGKPAMLIGLGRQYIYLL